MLLLLLPFCCVIYLFFHSCSDSDAKASINSKECSSALIVNAISGKTTADFFVTFLDCVYLELHTAFFSWVLWF